MATCIMAKTFRLAKKQILCGRVLGVGHSFRYHCKTQKMVQNLGFQVQDTVHHRCFTLEVRSSFYSPGPPSSSAHRRAAACARRVWSDQWCMLLLLLDMPVAAALVCIAALSSSELATVTPVTITVLHTLHSRWGAPKSRVCLSQGNGISSRPGALFLCVLIPVTISSGPSQVSLRSANVIK